MSNRLLKTLITACIFVALLLLVPAAIAGESRSVKSKSSCADADAGDNQHPSGKDRSCENGSLGRSQSDPDGMSNGGADKPGGSGGIDKGDQDFNNGCGNDDDFEDDNNGNCGGERRAAQNGVGNETSATAGRRTNASGGTTTAIAPVTRAAPRVLGETAVNPTTRVLATAGSIALLQLVAALGALMLGGALRNAERPRF